ncbi:MAG: hypothetical protein EAZ15_07300 [Sphingobacteriales bacterium]|nr:MAG: hypothetical protein EAZ15_07300 [Sphingobacteriales bacterium]
MLSFRTINDFENVMAQISVTSESELPQKIETIIDNSKFISLYTKQKNLNARRLIAPMGTESNEIIEDTTKIKPFEDLVPDPFFASVINDKLEINVAGVIYKITPFGTFIIKPEKLDRLNIILLENPFVENQNLKNHLFYRNNTNDDFYKIEDGIILLDTYNRAKNDLINTELESQNLSLSKANSKIQLSKNSLSKKIMGTGNDEWIYENIPTVQFGAKTWVGKLFQSLRGREEVHTQGFGPSNRVRVNFYNATWGVYSAIGVNVTMQKKNWIGWSSTNASEIRLGWDALEYYVGDLPSAPLINTPYAYQKFTPLDLPKITKQYVEVNLLGYDYKFEKGETLQKSIKQLYEWAKLPAFGLYPKQQDVNYAFKVWNDFTKKSISIIQERDEIIVYNQSSASKRLDWAVGIKLSSDFSDIKLGYAPLKFTLNRASVFGLAKYGSEWRGVRIVTQ